MKKTMLRVIKYHISIFTLVFILIGGQNAQAEDYLKWDNIRLKGDLSLVERYNDNIYLQSNNEQDDFITRFAPSLRLETALMEGIYCNLAYSALFEEYSKADNFKSDYHLGDFNFMYESKKKSILRAGIKYEINAEKPYSKFDDSKDYDIFGIYSDLGWNLNTITLIEGSYEHLIRSFNESRYQRDDYVKDRFNLNFLYTRNEQLPWILEYRYERQNNDELQSATGELITHAILSGFRWRPARRLSGTIQLGYFMSEFNGEKASDGWLTDTDLSYRVGEFTTFTINAQRGSAVSNSAARETLDYYVFLILGGNLNYRRFDPLQVTLEAFYRDRKFYLAENQSQGREDDLYRFSVLFDYQLKNWLTFSLDYSLRNNQSDQNDLEYRENLISAAVNISI